MVIPTDTVYGIACDAFVPAALDAVYRAKGRSGEKALPIMVSDVDMLFAYADIPESLRAALAVALPGPLTVVMRSRIPLPDGYYAKNGTVAFRIPDHFFSRELAKRLGRPIALTSANRSGENAPTRISDVIGTFGESGDISIIVDGGDLPASMASTVIDVTSRPYRIVREGPVTRAALELLFGESFR